METFAERVKRGLEILHESTKSLERRHDDVDGRLRASDDADASLRKDVEALKMDLSKVSEKLDTLSDLVKSEIHIGPIDAALSKMGADSAETETPPAYAPASATARSYTEPNGLEFPPQ